MIDKKYTDATQGFTSVIETLLVQMVCSNLVYYYNRNVYI